MMDRASRSLHPFPLHRAILIRFFGSRITMIGNLQGVSLAASLASLEGEIGGDVVDGICFEIGFLA